MAAAPRLPNRRRYQASLQVLLTGLLVGVVGLMVLSLAVVFAVRETQEARDRVTSELNSSASSTVVSPVGVNPGADGILRALEELNGTEEAT